MRVLLGISGGIAAYKSAELVRLLTRQGCDVRVVMTEAATQFISPLTFQALSAHPVHTQLLDANQENAMGHINLARWADLFLIAPATANCLAKFSYGLADDLLSTLYLAVECPVFIAPAMNQAMWHKPTTQENINRLIRHGMTIIGPDAGSQACGDIGPGRMTEPEAIVQKLCIQNNPGILQGKKILITAGPTREKLDPIRYITNRSSGKMGYALAEQAQQLGAQVTLISGPVVLAAPEHVNTVLVESAEEMYTAVMQHIADQDIMIAAAAVADYTPVNVKAEKIKTQNDQTELQLHKTKDIVASVASLTNKPFTVGFAAETENLKQYAQDKLTRKNLDMIAANWVGQKEGGFDSAVNALQVYWQNGQKIFPMTNKSQLANQLLALIAEKLHA
ncbi:MAG TPA: bifunctional phosphopantothenoylcysteine decarboxylase/phosphopantothenate--cysteine ligase CoaBC [Methyloprofundus sp.]|uniref:bifunctional phosphopantothenoylcysteine decarboxylase/phosphopantothenate--cysteine ligase CoaBC n=1 Tax=Methyloprofundus sp. TaxID=2020875 RepID=UPI0017F796CF|nr:bifunctional phosphopantothenoylcysteine decarboxylase/phosphopantothenate--cysteine ligase CoaBC [Methyloprofundus sp.]HIG64137.1 bifunctional phosphopantothenoylcysteine decarboxylase/phosphopantothenate--cysteine ligase CoaBC [Methyloprofundus sp.]HIL78041.1 bifunctional phosphopantothenoylcysteine decarboxylase/phosphopantothenate--cysteine ligase CoaBC [Methylococcales bacterium]